MNLIQAYEQSENFHTNAPPIILNTCWPHRKEHREPFGMTLLLLPFLVSIAISFPHNPPSVQLQALRGEAFSDSNFVLNLNEQAVAFQTQLPRGLTFNITRMPSSFSLSHGSIPDILTLDPPSLGCTASRPLPPNLDDCGTLLYLLSRAKPSPTAPEPQYCHIITHKSCQAFNCAGECATKGYDFQEFQVMLTHVMADCVIELGMGGLVLGNKTEKEYWGRMAGLEHSAAGEQSISYWNPCLFR